MATMKVTYHTKAEIEQPVRRASGECVCDVCGKDYYHHPKHVYSDHPNGRTEFGPDNWALVLIETCAGEKFKL